MTEVTSPTARTDAQQSAGAAASSAASTTETRARWRVADVVAR
jgi:hypothetical protein